MAQLFFFFKARPTAGRQSCERLSLIKPNKIINNEIIATLFNPDSYQPFYQGLLF